MKKVPSHTRAQDYQVNDPCYDIGGGVPPNGIKVKDPKWYLKEQHTSNVIPTCAVMSINNTIFKSQPSTPMQAFVSIEKNTFYGN
jgi:hypothetical protein